MFLLKNMRVLHFVRYVYSEKHVGVILRELCLFSKTYLYYISYFMFILKNMLKLCICTISVLCSKILFWKPFHFCAFVKQTQTHKVHFFSNATFWSNAQRRGLFRIKKHVVSTIIIFYLGENNCVKGKFFYRQKFAIKEFPFHMIKRICNLFYSHI